MTDTRRGVTVEDVTGAQVRAQIIFGLALLALAVVLSVLA